MIVRSEYDLLMVLDDLYYYLKTAKDKTPIMEAFYQTLRQFSREHALDQDPGRFIGKPIEEEGA